MYYIYKITDKINGIKYLKKKDFVFVILLFLTMKQIERGNLNTHICNYTKNNGKANKLDLCLTS